MNETEPFSTLPWHRRLLYGLTNWGLFSAGALNLAIGTWSALNEQVTSAATSLTAGLVLLFAGTIERFESLKGLGIEAKTRQLDQKIEQAADALKRLKELAELTGASLVDMNSKMGRYGSAPSPREAYALAQKVRSTMSALGSEPSAMRQALEPWIKITCYDVARACTAPLARALSEKRKELERERAGIRKPVDPNDPVLLRTTAALNEAGVYTTQRLDKLHEFHIEDYPERFLQLFEDVPLVDQQTLAPIRANARQFAPAMLELRQKLELADPEPWFNEIEAHRWSP